MTSWHVMALANVDAMEMLRVEGIIFSASSWQERHENLVVYLIGSIHNTVLTLQA